MAQAGGGGGGGWGDPAIHPVAPAPAGMGGWGWTWDGYAGRERPSYCPANVVSWGQPNTALICGAMESMHHSCYKEYSGHLIGLRENINTTDLRRTNQVTVVRIG